jgi:hypothetical protein
LEADSITLSELMLAVFEMYRIGQFSGQIYIIMDEHCRKQLVALLYGKTWPLNCRFVVVRIGVVLQLHALNSGA